MAVGTVAVAATATTAGMSILVCVLLSQRCAGKQGEEGGDEKIAVGNGGSREQREREAEMERRLSRRPAEPPSTWQESVAAVAETIRFTYSETLGRWSIGDLAFGIRHHMRRQGLQVAAVFAGSDCLKLEGPDLMDELTFLSRLLDLCIIFSKKPFSVFLKCSDYCSEDILFRKHKAGLLKPAFTVLRDRSLKCILLIVRGMHSIKDTLTAATGLVVPFHHSVFDEFVVTKVVLGYAHCGMVSSAHWIAKCATPCLLKAVGQYPAYNIKIVGNSLGAGIAALLTYILRERIEFSSATCIAFAPAACMTWDLAESGQNFIVTIINGSDLVPTFSIVSADNLRLEVAASSWLRDLCDQFQQPFISCARTISNASQDFLRNAKQAALALARCMDCLGILSYHEEEIAHQARSWPKKDTDSTLIKQHQNDMFAEKNDHAGSCSNQNCNGTEVEASMQRDEVIGASTEEEMIERELCLELEKELHMQGEADVRTQEENASGALEELMDKEGCTCDAVGNKQEMSLQEIHFFPPGRIRHIVAAQASDANSGRRVACEPSINMYETPRHLYGKIRLSPNMIKDHYMPVYRKMIGLMIENLKKGESSYATEKTVNLSLSCVQKAI